MGARCGSCLTSKTNVLRKADSSRAESHATSVVRSGVDRLPQHVIDAIMCRTPDTTESGVSKSVATIVVATCLDATSAKLSKEKGERVRHSEICTRQSPAGLIPASNLRILPFSARRPARQTVIQGSAEIAH